MPALDFADTGLLQHPEVKKAYDVLTDGQTRGSVDDFRTQMFLNVAAKLSAFGAQPDPHLVASVLLFPAVQDADQDEAVAENLQKNFDELTIAYAVAQSVMMAPMGITEVFPELSPQLQTGAVAVYAAMNIVQIEEVLAQTQDKRALKDMLDGIDHGDPVMPTFAEMADYVDLRQREPKLMAAFDTARQSLVDAAKGKPSAPAAKKNAAPTP